MAKKSTPEDPSWAVGWCHVLAGPAERPETVEAYADVFLADVWIKPLRQLISQSISGATHPRRAGLVPIGERAAVLRELLVHPDLWEVALSRRDKTTGHHESFDVGTSKQQLPYGTVTGTGDRIKRQADELMARKRALKAAPKVKDGVDKILASIAKLKSGQLEGSNNPKLKAYAAYGVKEHSSRQGSCDAKEITISGDYCKNPNPKRFDCKMDCVKGCTIVEIKPKDAESLGWQQSRAYVEGLQKMYLAHRKDGKNMFTGSFSRFETCLSSDKSTLNVTAAVDTYDFCPKAADLAETIEKHRCVGAPHLIEPLLDS